MDEPYILWQFVAWYFAIGLVCALIALNLSADSGVDKNGRTRMHVTDFDVEASVWMFFLWPVVIFGCVFLCLGMTLGKLQDVNDHSINWHPIRWFRERYHPFEWFFLWPAHLFKWIGCRIDNYMMTHETKKARRH